MADYDPVPPEFLLTHEVAAEFIPDIFFDDGVATSRELSLGVLVCEGELEQAELFIFQRLGNGNIETFFRQMRDLVNERRGKHVQQVIAAACLHPERDRGLNLANAATEYMEARFTKVYKDLPMLRMMLGGLSMDAALESEENERKVRSGKLFVPDKPPSARQPLL